MNAMCRHRWVLIAGIVVSVMGFARLPASGDEPRPPAVRLFTPEPGGAVADKGYMVQWKDSETPGCSVELRRVEWPSQRSERINLTPIDADAGGFSGNQYLWDTSAVPEGLYQIAADLLDPNGRTVATSRAEGFLRIRHESSLPDQDIYIYAFVHLKNQFLMDSERNGIARLLRACRNTRYQAFEFTFNWPIAWYLENGLADDRPGHDGVFLFTGAPDLVADLRRFADDGGGIGCYDPLAGWHYRNIWFEHGDLIEDWYALGTRAILYEAAYQDQVRGDLDPGRPGAKHYLDRLFGRQTVELGGNLPTVCYHITRLLGNRVLAQMSPQSIGGIAAYRIIDGRDYMDGQCVYWYLGQMGFNHFPPAPEPSGEPEMPPAEGALGLWMDDPLSSGPSDQREDPFTRQIPMLGAGRLYDAGGVPLDNPQCQSFQQWVDSAISGIRARGLPTDMMYIFEHSISLQNTGDPYALLLQDQLARAGFDWMQAWGLTRLAHMNCAAELRLPENQWDCRFRPEYEATAQQIDLAGQIIETAFQYVQHLARTDPHIHLVTGDDLYAQVLQPEGREVTASTLAAICGYILNHLYRPEGVSYVRLPAYTTLSGSDASAAAAGRYYTLAETFKLLADALGTQGRGEPLPVALRLAYVIGPTQLRNDLETVATGRTFQVSEVVEAVRGLSMVDPLGDPALWPKAITPGVSYQVPSYVTLRPTGADQAVEINAAEMLILMARTYLAIRAGENPGPVKAEPARALTEWPYKVQSADGGYSPFEVNVYYKGTDPFPFNHIQLWTFKPAEFSRR